MTNKNIILGITGSIAATKCQTIIDELKKLQFNIKCIVTKNGEQFIDIDNLQDALGHEIITEQDKGSEGANQDG